MALFLGSELLDFYRNKLKFLLNSNLFSMKEIHWNNLFPKRVKQFFLQWIARNTINLNNNKSQ